VMAGRRLLVNERHRRVLVRLALLPGADWMKQFRP
jgi:hypothetical protein